jgi:8-oxo-dGTP pyrophosphatase MutT (NUDIX family)
MHQSGVMLIIKNGLILAVSRRHDKSKFGLPGGKLEPNESHWSAAIRETKEETGIKVLSYKEIFF